MPANALLLQGPVGPFFVRLANQLRRQGFRVYKINFNGGDTLFYRRGAISYRGNLAQWPRFFEEKLKALAIERVYLFGACRSYHAIARSVALRHAIPTFVFEEGHLRPDYITMEQVAPNGASLVPRDPQFYREFAAKEPPPVRSVGRVFGAMAAYAVAYYIAGRLCWRQYPHYQHHRPFNVFGEGSKWLRSAFGKLRHRVRERHIQVRLQTTLKGQTYLVPLQVHCDTQVVHRSPFVGVSEFVEAVVASFARHAPAETMLVIKHHPMDRPYRDYTQLIENLSQRYDLNGRLLYVHDLHLPTLLVQARGTVVINSTVGLSSMYHGTPVKVLGDALYDVPGLTSQASLDDFWCSPGVVDKAFYRRFRSYLLAQTQINGNFYRRLANTGNPMGVVWPDTDPGIPEDSNRQLKPVIGVYRRPPAVVGGLNESAG